MDIKETELPLTERKVVRRGLLAGLAAFGAAAAMKVTGAGKAQATDGVALVIGDDAQTAQSETRLTASPSFVGSVLHIVGSGTPVGGTSAISGVVDGEAASALRGHNWAAGRGVSGTSQGGIGVHGSTGVGNGVFGEIGSELPPGPQGAGVLGHTSVAGSAAVSGVAAGNTPTGVKGVSNAGTSPASYAAEGTGSGIGVHGKSNSGVGVRGESASAPGVVGSSTAPLTVGVRGVNAGGNGIGVEGVTNLVGDLAGSGNGSGIGVMGRALSGTGISGLSSTGHGVMGTTSGASGFGVWGINGNNGTGVRGISSLTPGGDGNGNGIGVQGKSTGGPGVEGISVNSLGVRGISTNSTAMVGISTNGHGLYGSTSSAASAGFVGENLGGGLAGYFAGNVFVTGALQVGGAKNAVLKMQDGTLASVYCQESPEPYFEDFGRAQLVGGVANVVLEREFAQLVAGGNYHVFTEAEGPSGGLYVSRRTATGFEVRDPSNGNAPFSYRIVTRRKDVEGRRFARVVDTVAPGLAAARAAAGVTGTPPAAGPTPLSPTSPPASPNAPVPPAPSPTAPSNNVPPVSPTQPGSLLQPPSPGSTGP